LLHTITSAKWGIPQVAELNFSSTENLQKEELDFWEGQKRCGDDIDLKLARDLPDDTPDFILKMMGDFEDEAARFCFSGAQGRVLDAGCGNGNLLLRALKNENPKNEKGIALAEKVPLQVIGMDFSGNMLGRAALRANDEDRTGFFQGSVTSLPFRDQSFDRVVSSGVLTCLPNAQAAARALQEFYRVLKPEGVLVVDFFSRISHYTLIRKHLFREPINPPEYVSPEEFQRELEEAGFAILAYRGFDFKPCQGYLFLSRWRSIIDPGYFQERLSRFLERKVLPGHKGLNLLGYRIYVKCIKK
jgi:SAM-dependent methyltransferase